ncbi:MAG TPA: MG2 domain-containing protein [Thermoanaerobaculia bacterium]|nr:MG2 domain-containing protein [Thermoanaerobaculia bacterium]
MAPIAGTEEGSPYGPLTAESLQPVLQPVRHPDGFVSRLQVVFARPVVPEARVGDLAGGGTVLRLVPEVPGELRFTDVSTLTFEPAEPFEPSTEYRVALESFVVGERTLQAPEGAWTTTFSTPALAFDRLALQSFDPESRRAEVDVVFSAPVDPRAVRRASAFRVVGAQGEDRGVPVVRPVESGSPNAVRFRLEGVEMRPGRTVRLELRAREQGDTALAAAVASPVQAMVELGEGPQLSIKSAHIGETASGFFIEVICDDSAVPGQRWYWDRRRQTSYQLSPRCELAEADLRRAVRVEPAMALQVAPGEAGFKLLGDLRRGSVALRIDAGARSSAGGTLREAFAAELVVPARSPQVRFQVSGRYLPRAAWSSVPVRHLNVKQAQLTVRHVPPENLVFWMSAEQGERTDERTSNLVAQSTLPLPGGLDEEVTSYLDLRSQVPADTKGLLEVRLVAGNVTSSVRVVLTDLVLVAKRTGTGARTAAPEPARGRRAGGGGDGDDEVEGPWGEGVVAWALDAHSLEPVRVVEIKLVRPSGQALDTCRTDGSGGCGLTATRGIDPTPPLALVAMRGADVTYLRFRDLEAEVQEERVAGAPYREPGAYRAALYTERGVYRPGEVAHLAAIVRDERQVAPPEGMPAVLHVLDPRGKTVQRHNLRTNSAGFVAADLALQDFAMTGRWQARLEVAERAIATHRFQVEELVPERMKVTATPARAEALRGEPVEVGVSARYLFGGVPAGAPVELQCELQPSTFAPRGAAEFHYGVWSAEGAGGRALRPLDLGTVQGVLDPGGAASLQCAGGEAGGVLAGHATLVARAAVAEAGSGRTTVAETRLPVHPERYYLGLKASTGTARSGEEVRVEGVVVDWEGRSLTAAGSAPQSVKLQVLRLEDEYGLFFDEERGHQTYRRYQRPVLEESREARVSGGRFELQFVPQEVASGYVVRAEAASARTDLVLEGELTDWYWSPYDSEREVTPRPQRPTWIALTTPERARAGQPFELRFQAPYRGRALLTIETDRVVQSVWRKVEAGEQVWRVEVDDFVSNVYATAFVIKDPHLESPEAYLPDRAFGVASIALEPVEFTQQVVLQVPEEVRSLSDLTVELQVSSPGRGAAAAGPVYATVAAVDEGLLSLTRFVSPDPFAAIFPRRALGVSTFETVGWAMMLPPAGSGDTSGGDQLGGLLGRIQPITPVALWSGVVEVPASGRLRVTLPVPEYRGQLRVMAVTADQRRMGRAEAQVYVRDPLVLQTTVPRFLIEGDEAMVPALVTNVSGARRNVTVEISVEDLLGPAFRGDLERSSPVELLGSSRQVLDLADQASGTVRFRLRARPSSGAARIVVTASDGDLRSSESVDVPLLPTGEPIRTVRRIDLREVADAADGELDLRPYVEGWKPMSERTDFWLTTNPYADVLQHADYLLRYPYGCVEQTTSSTRPLLHITKFLPALRSAAGEPAPDVDAMAQSGIDRVLTMQTPSGGFTYWPGGSEPAYWASAYALHLLLDGQRAGFAVPAERLEEAVDWMERELARGDLAEREDWYSKNSEPYMHYVLAVAGRPQKARAEQLLRRMTRPGSTDDGETREQVFLLQAALQVAGDHRYEAQLERPDVSNVRSERSTGWTFYSDRRRRGLQLATLVDLFGRDPAIEPLADLVAEALRGSARSYTTQELVWGITGLGKFVEQGATLAGEPQLVANGAALEVESSPDLPGNWSWRLHRASEHNQLTLRLPQRGDGALFLVVSTEGVPVVPPADLVAGGDGLRLERRYHRAGGEPFDPQVEGLDLGELMHVELLVTNTGPERMSNLALVDRVAAGLEIENPRLGRERATDWIDADELWAADHLDVRDDRLEVFGMLEPGQTRKVVYSVRATAAGRFTVPASSVEAMYDPRRWARGTPLALTVRGEGE